MDHRSWFSLLKYYAAIGSFMLMVNISLADTIRQTVEIYQPVLITRGIYTSFQLDGGFHYSEPGKPDLPFITVNLLLPPGHVIDEVIIEEKGIPVWFENTVPIPVNRQYPVSVKFSDSAADLMLASPDSSVYLGKSPYPVNLCGTFSTQFLSGHSIGVVTLNPLLYYPDKQAVQLYGLIVLKVITRPYKTAMAALSFLKDKAQVTSQITELVINRDALDDYQPYYSKDREVFDMLIITDESFIPAFAGFIIHKLRLGVKCQVISVQTIAQLYEGIDIQEKIRNCVIDQYQSSGISHVLLAGDADAADPAHNLVPHRGFYVETYTGGETDADIPSDMYYACLDGNWNNDGDEYWGEPGEEDLFSEVTVGRICADNVAELQNQLEKIILFESEPVLPDINKALMLGEMLSPGTFGGNYKTEVAHGSDHNGYVTAGFPDEYEVSELYEMNTLWERNEVLTHINESGTHWINHLGHADNTWCLKMPDHFVKETNIINDGKTRSFNIIYSQGCYNAAFDNRNASGTYTTDCFTETAQGIGTFQVAAIGNSRYGWYMTNSTAGASQYFDRQFFDAVFGENILSIGEANTGSKEDNAGYILNNRYIRWCAYTLNLLGDPSMKLFSHMPEPVVCTLPPAVHVSDTGMLVGAGIENLKVIAIQDSLLAGEGSTAPDGSVFLDFLVPLSVDHPLEIYISGSNTLLYHQNVRVWEQGACLVVDSVWFVQNGLMSADTLAAEDSIQFVVAVRNAGDDQSPQAVLKVSAEWISFVDSILQLPPIPPGEQMIFPGEISGFIPTAVPDLTISELSVTLEDESSHMAICQSLIIRPQLSILAEGFNDQQGNNNSAPDPGETVLISIRISNTGHDASKDGNIIIYPSSGLVHVNNQTIPFAGLMPFTDTLITVQITPDFILPASFPFEILVNLISQDADNLASATFNYQIGSPSENFETGNFQRFPWELSGDEPWQIDTISAGTGQFSAKSGPIGHNQQSRMKMVWESMSDDSISFDYRISSEAGYDFLYFFVDGVLKGRWAGESGWKRFTMNMAAGIHEYEWVYKKDVYFSQGEDGARVDNIHLPLPVNHVVFAGPDLISCEGEPVSPEGWVKGITEVNWLTGGDGTFSDVSVWNPVYFPGDDDKATGSVKLSLSAVSDQCEILRDSLIAVFLIIPPKPAVPVGNDTVCVNFEPFSTYEVPLTAGVEEYFWELEPMNSGTLVPAGNQAVVYWKSDTGNVYLRVQASNFCGVSGFSEVKTICLKICETSLTEPVIPEILIWPNPSSGTIHIEINPPDELGITINGLEGYHHEWRFNSGSYADMVSLSGIRPGLYVLVIKTSEHVWVRKISVLHGN